MHLMMTNRAAALALGLAGVCVGGCSGDGASFRLGPHVAAPRAAVDAASIADRDPRGLPIFDGRSGEAMDWRAVMARVADAEVIILGEQHDDGVAHAVQLAIVQDAAGGRGGGALSMEMLERDEQPLVDDFIEGVIDAETFARLTESVSWAGEGSWARWYQPIIDAAMAGGWTVVAANAPRRYVRLARTAAGYERLRALPRPRSAFISLPRTWPLEYRQRFIDVMNRAGGAEDDEAHAQPQPQMQPPATQPATHPATRPATRPASPHGPMRPEDIDPSFRSQLLWDSTMADSIARALRQRGIDKVVHLVGQFHSDFAGGTVQELRARAPRARILTVSMQRIEADALRPRDRDRADIVIYTGPR